MSGPYDDIDVANLEYEAVRSMDEAAEYLQAKLKAMKWINRSRGKTYDLADTKKALESIKKTKELL